MTDSSFDLKPHKIAIIGSGKVGTTFAYALLLSGQVGEIVLIDVDKQRTEGEVMDLSDAVPLTHPTRILQGDYPDCAGADVVVITAGVSQKPGETRIDLLKRNTSIFAQIVPQILRHNPQPLILNATNPVDILSYAAWKLSGLPSQRVIGSGTILDTARFRALLSARFGLDARSIHAYIIGEHGDSEVAVWSSANIAGIPLEDYCRSISDELCVDDRVKIAEKVPPFMPWLSGCCASWKASCATRTRSSLFPAWCRGITGLKTYISACHLWSVVPGSRKYWSSTWMKKKRTLSVARQR
jgi:malate/lactate dehydrogenase